MKYIIPSLIFIVSYQSGFSQTFLSQAKGDSSLTKESSKRDVITIRFSSDSSKLYHWVLAQSNEHLFKLKKQTQEADTTAFIFKETGVPGKSELVFNQVDTSGEIISSRAFSVHLKVSYKTTVHKVITEYGDIAEIMEMFGVKRAGSWGFRKFLTRFLSVKTAAKVHKVYPEKFLEMVQSAIEKKQTIKQ